MRCFPTVCSLALSIASCHNGVDGRLPAITEAGETAEPEAAPSFSRRRLTSRYYSEGAAIGDINGDAHLDIVSGPFWYAGPNFRDRREIYRPTEFPIDGYSVNSFFSFIEDVDADGSNDVIVVGFPGSRAHWYRQPARADAQHWERYPILAAVGMESPWFVDVDDDGRRELLCALGGRLGYAEPGEDQPTEPWTFRPISDPGPWATFLHGLGVGDVNGDGRTDVLTAFGWFRQPRKAGAKWTPHVFRFGTLGGAQMFAYDVDDDGDNDVITSLNAHGWGLSWFEQTATPGGLITFVERPIMTQGPVGESGFPFSQPHALALADVDGDGLLDIVTGKTFWAHNGADPGAKDPAVVYAFLLRRAPTVSFQPVAIDTNSGIGRQFATADLDGDGKLDIVTGNKKGVFVFTQR